MIALPAPFSACRKLFCSFPTRGWRRSCLNHDYADLMISMSAHRSVPTIRVGAGHARLYWDRRSDRRYRLDQCSRAVEVAGPYGPLYPVAEYAIQRLAGGI